MYMDNGEQLLKRNSAFKIVEKGSIEIYGEDQGRKDTIAPVARATVNFLSERSIVVYRKVYPISRETLAAYSL